MKWKYLSQQFGNLCYFAQYAHGMACMRKEYPICVWALHLPHTHMGAHANGVHVQATHMRIAIWDKAKETLLTS